MAALSHPARPHVALLLVALTALSGCSGFAPVAAPAPTPASPTASPTAAPLRVVGLGDSVMAGTRCGCPGLVAALLAATPANL